MIKRFTTPGLALALTGLLSLSACKKDNTSTAVAEDADVSFSMATDNPLVNVASTSSNGQLTTMATATTSASVKWTEAIANINKFKLEAKKNGSTYEISSAGLTNVDLFAINPAAINATLPKGTYTQAELQVQLVKTTGKNLPLVLKGTYTTKAAATVPVEFDFNENIVLRSALGNLTVDGKNNFTARLNLHLNKVFANITAQQLDAATRTSGTVVISSTTNTSLYQKLLVDILSSGDAKLELKKKK